jgi:ATP-dependent DNA helicase RecG
MQTNVLKQLSFDFTEDQKHSIKDILDDLKKPERMNRLLQGDVGSGKTIVAFIGIIAAVEAGGQGAIMAPTEILARQHFETLSPLAKKVGVSLNLLTGRDKGTARNKKLIDLKEGRTNIIIGTHALFQADVVFKDLRLAVVDEQHRFGVRQRLELGKKGSVVDLLLMTATPIPRSLALAHYGDMDFSIIKQKPPGRKPINTALISSSRIDEVVDKLKNSLAKGAQAYWVCPLIEESEVLHYTAAERRFEKLRAKLGEGVVELVHGKMSSDTKDEIMDRFTNGETKLLVATTVIEVGVNVPKANIMVVENAEKFGLAQLHQLRGRVGRGTNQSTCLFVYKEPLNSASKKRLSILRETEDGFKISEVDLSLRGSGDAIGTAQSGLPRFRMANNEMIEMLMETAHQQARYLLAKDPNLETPQGKAVRNLLWLMDQDKSVRLFSIG